jgi:hypothetical protein
MKTFIPYILSACLAVAFCFLSAEDAFSKTDQEHKADTTSSATDGPPPYVSGLTAGRARSLVGVAVGLISLIVGRRAKARAAVNPGSGRSWFMTSLVLGVIAIILSLVHLVNTTGGFGTGAGKAGAIVALVLGLVGATLSGLTLRSGGRQ